MTELIAPWAEAWLPAYLLAAGLTLGALVALALGHLLGEAWLAPLRPSLAAMTRAAPVLLILALPLLLAAPVLYPWAAAPMPGATPWYAPDAFRLRSFALLLLWAGLGWLLARPRVRGRTAGGALLLLVLTGALAMEDWALSRDHAWTGSLQGLALVVEQIGAAMALATLLALQRNLPGEAARTGLERALLTFAMATLWLWFVQYIVVYAGNLPQEAAWYLRRSDGVWGWVKAGIAVPTLLAAIGLALNDQPDRGLAFTIDNCSVTRLDHLASDGHAGWRIPMVNQQPWIADASHAAMHQPAGPEVATSPTKLA